MSKLIEYRTETEALAFCEEHGLPLALWPQVAITETQEGLDELVGWYNQPEESK